MNKAELHIYYTDNYIGGREESRRLLEKALAVHTGDEERAKTLTGALKKGEHGKPYIEGFSCFSISHTGTIWAVLIVDCECGLDIQLSRKCDYGAIAGRWFAPEDAALIAAALDEEVDVLGHEDANEIDHEDAEAEKEPVKARDLFFRIWTRREALVKALGGTVYDSDIPAVIYDQEATGVQTVITDRQYSIIDIRLPDMQELYAAICCEAIGSNDKVSFISLQD